MYTRLDIINSMIAATGARPLTASQDRHPSYIKALTTLDSVRQQVLSMGLWFNEETREVAQQSNGEVVVPQDCVAADPEDRRDKLVLRGSRMYNVETGNFQIGKDVTLRMRFDVTLEDCPLSARIYIGKRSVWQYFLDNDGAGPKLEGYMREKDEAWVVLNSENIHRRQTNIFDSAGNTVTRMSRGYGRTVWR